MPQGSEPNAHQSAATTPPTGQPSGRGHKDANLKREMLRIAEIVRRKTREALAVLDEPMPGAEQGVLLEGQVIDGEIVIDAEAEPGGAKA